MSNVMEKTAFVYAKKGANQRLCFSLHRKFPKSKFQASNPICGHTDLAETLKIGFLPTRLI